MHAKSESGFEDVSRSSYIDFGVILASIWSLKSLKTNLEIERILKRFWTRFWTILDPKCHDIGVAWARPGGMREAAGGLNSLTESDKS